MNMKWLVRPEVSVRVLHQDLDCAGDVVLVEVVMRGWGLLAISLIGEPSRLKHFFKAVLWPIPINCDQAIGWSSTRYFIPQLYRSITVVAPRGRILNMCCMNALGWSQCDFEVPIGVKNTAEKRVPKADDVDVSIPASNLAQADFSVELKSSISPKQMHPVMPDMHIEYVKISPVVRNISFDQHQQSIIHQNQDGT